MYQKLLRAGTAMGNITPELGANLAGSMTNHQAREVHEELHVRTLVLDNGSARIALSLVDSCAVAREIIDYAKQRVAQRSGIPVSHLLVAATHTHSAPACAHLFQSPPDPFYGEFLANRIADSVQLAVNRLQPARIGFGTAAEPRLLFNRRYRMKPGTIAPDPFGRANDRVKMNPPAGSPDILEPAGPIDPDLGLLAVHGMDGAPVCLFGNYALHYVGGVPRGVVSPDYFPAWGRALMRQAGSPGPQPLTMMSNGCSGNINGVDVRAQSRTYAPFQRIEEVAAALAATALPLWRGLKFEPEAELRAAVEEVELGVRLPSGSDVAAAQALLASAPEKERDSGHYTKVEHIYARETILLHDSFEPSVKVPVQAIRIGGLALATFPGEAFVELGLEVKKRSPFRNTFLVELANSYNGYIPTEAAHADGGYETWRAKSSYLETGAAPKLVAAALRCLGRIA